MTNRKARHHFEILQRCEAGIALRGTEVKSARAGHVSLDEGFARCRDGEVWLYGVHIKPYAQAAIHNHEPLRPRKLLLHRRQIRLLEDHADQQGCTLIPLAFYFKRGYAKVELGLARGKRDFDKREAIKKREQQREMARIKR